MDSLGRTSYLTGVPTAVRDAPSIHSMPTSLTRGLYEALITEGLVAELAELVSDLAPERSALRAIEAPDRIALHLSRAIERALAAIPEDERLEVGVDVARRLLDTLGSAIPKIEVERDRPVGPAEMLRAVVKRRPDGSPERIEQPLIPLLDTTVLTNAPGEPRVGSQILAEIASADAIDVVMAFIRRTGIGPLTEALRRHCESGRSLRVLTTIYTGSTEAAALDDLVRLGADVRVSYDTTTTRLHAKAWYFHRRSGQSTAYVGSSNLTHSAQVSGLEWNVRLSAARNAAAVAKIAAAFEGYWEAPEFEPYDRAKFLERYQRKGARELDIELSPLEVRLEPFQTRLLEEIELSRSLGHHRNLLVSATGTGKTVMAAVDYRRLRDRLGRSRLLFVAHRDEILEQSRRVFRHVLRDASFGERWVGGERPDRFEHVFASIQSLASQGLSHLDPEHFDVFIVDEFHHAAAPTYERLLAHVRPRELLGLTATPERSDGLPILSHFDERIAAELRLWDAIDQHHLSPFVYFGVHDGLDLSNVPWKRGRGYDVAGLTNLYTADDVWAHRVIDQVKRRAEDPATMRALGFCVSVEHARFMARCFAEAGIPSAAVWADSSPDERASALRALREGRLRVLFSVDLFNEGVDVPLVDTLLLLRPTDSPTLYLQQLGRGLRRAEGKRVCTVLDFVGQHRREFRFDRRLRALLGGTRKALERQVEQGFPFLPAGCHMELDPVASQIVLRNIRESLPSRWDAKVEELRAVAAAASASGSLPSLRWFLDETGLELDDVYGGNHSWSELCEAAGLPIAPHGPHEKALRRACGRLLHVDDVERLDAWAGWLAADQPPQVGSLSERSRRLARMLVASAAGTALTKDTTLEGALSALWEHPQVRAELVELFHVLRERLTHLALALDEDDRHHDVPLRVHARYTRVEILAAFGVGKRAKVDAWQTGVYSVPEAKADLLAFTLDKSGGGFSPTTRYQDYAISPSIVHWQSQSITRADSPTGLRYREHARRGSSIMLFARLDQDERAFWFLGPARYVSHEGERPMSIRWRLAHALPGDLFAQFAAAVA